MPGQVDVIGTLKSKDVVRVVDGQFTDMDGVPMTGIHSYTWAGKPAANEVSIRTIINIPASEFPHTSVPLQGLFFITNGVNWLPFGDQILAQEWGSITAPIASVTSQSSDGEQLFTLPGGTPNALAGMLHQSLGIEIVAFFRQTGTHTGTGAINARMGVSDTLLSNGGVGFAAGTAAGSGYDARIVSEVRPSTATRLIYNAFQSTNGSAVTSKITENSSHNFGSAYDHNFSFSRTHGAASVDDTTTLVGYRIKLVP